MSEPTFPVDKVYTKEVNILDLLVGDWLLHTGKSLDRSSNLTGNYETWIPEDSGRFRALKIDTIDLRNNTVRGNLYNLETGKVDRFGSLHNFFYKIDWDEGKEYFKLSSRLLKIKVKDIEIGDKFKIWKDDVTLTLTSKTTNDDGDSFTLIGECLDENLEEFGDGTEVTRNANNLLWLVEKKEKSYFKTSSSKLIWKGEVKHNFERDVQIAELWFDDISISYHLNLTNVRGATILLETFIERDNASAIKRLNDILTSRHYDILKVIEETGDNYFKLASYDWQRIAEIYVKIADKEFSRYYVEQAYDCLECFAIVDVTEVDPEIAVTTFTLDPISKEALEQKVEEIVNSEIASEEFSRLEYVGELRTENNYFKLSVARKPLENEVEDFPGYIPPDGYEILCCTTVDLLPGDVVPYKQNIDETYEEQIVKELIIKPNIEGKLIFSNGEEEIVKPNWSWLIARKEEYFKLSHQKKICLDFDNTIHTDCWVDEKPCGVPLEGAVEFCHKLKEDGFEIKLLSCNSKTKAKQDAISEWLRFYSFPEIEVVDKKPHTDYYVDDKAVHFDGDYEEVLGRIGKDQEKYASEKSWIEDVKATTPEGYEFYYSAVPTKDLKAEDLLNEAKNRIQEVEDLKNGDFQITMESGETFVDKGKRVWIFVFEKIDNYFKLSNEAFKVGDRVKIIGLSDYHSYKNKEGVILGRNKTVPSMWNVAVDDPTFPDIGMKENELEKIDSYFKLANSVQKFEVGDRVTNKLYCISREYLGNIISEGTILGEEDSSYEGLYVVEFDKPQLESACGISKIDRETALIKLGLNPADYDLERTTIYAGSYLEKVEKAYFKQAWKPGDRIKEKDERNKIPAPEGYFDIFIWKDAKGETEATDPEVGDVIVFDSLYEVITKLEENKYTAYRYSLGGNFWDVVRRPLSFIDGMWAWRPVTNEYFKQASEIVAEYKVTFSFNGIKEEHWKL